MVKINMGDPKFARRKYSTPSHPWQSDRIKEENELLHKYGLKNKREVWKAKSSLTDFRQFARTLLARLRTGDEQAMREKDELLASLSKLGILTEDAQLDDILALSVEDFLARRLQTIAYMKGLAFTPHQSRQFIIHGHIAVKGKKVTIPSYMIKKSEEDFIEYYENSRLNDPDHPMIPKTAVEETEASQVKGKIDLKKEEADVKEPEAADKPKDKTEKDDKKAKDKKPNKGKKDKKDTSKKDEKKGGKKDDKKE
jgi:small subunit ribosomal protein S4